jgi:hypothetical protein
MQDKELVELYKQLYLKCKEYIKELEEDEHYWEDGDHYRKAIKELEDKIDNVINDELTRLAEDMKLYEGDLYYK